MEFAEFGNQSSKALMLLPGTACKWHQPVLDCVCQRMEG